MTHVKPQSVLSDSQSSTWLRSALAAALDRDPVDAAADAAALVRLLDRRAALVLREELLGETAQNSAYPSKLER